MIHELVHQWWGLGNMFDTAEEDSPWSAEGLTVYTTYRIVKALYGEEYAREHYIDQWQQAVDDYYLNFYVRNPAYLQMLPEEERLQISNSLRYVAAVLRDAAENFEGRAAGGRRAGDGHHPQQPVQSGAGPDVPLSELPGFSGGMRFKGGGLEPCVK